MSAHPHFLWADLFNKDKSNRRSIIHTLKENILFCTLSPRELNYLSTLVYERVYQPDEPIFEQNDRGLGMYLIAKGQVAIRTQKPQGEVLVTLLNEGSFFGEIALVDPGSFRTASAIATERCVVIGFFKPDLTEILERKPAMGVKILFQLSMVLGRRLVETTERITQLSRSQKKTKNMKPSRDIYWRRDLAKLGYLAFALLGAAVVFIVTPTLSTPTLLSIVVTTLLSPSVAALERRGHTRGFAIALIFFLLSAAFLIFGFWGIQSSQSEWNLFKERAPHHFELLLQSLRNFENSFKHKYPLLSSIHFTDDLLSWGQRTGLWFMEHGPALMGDLLTNLLSIPPLTFVLLSEGRTLRRQFYQLVPNRYFESFFLITTQIINVISDYIRAKLLEAILVGFLVMAGLLIIRSPYFIVLGVIAGITNIIPYLGPILGAVSGILLAGFGSQRPEQIVLIIIVYATANIVDTVLIFPIVVAQLVKLHPLILTAAVIVGQHYYGLVGMLISVPIATALKVIFHEIYVAVYEHRSIKMGPALESNLDPMLRGE